MTVLQALQNFTDVIEMLMSNKFHDNHACARHCRAVNLTILDYRDAIAISLYCDIATLYNYSTQ